MISMRTAGANDLEALCLLDEIAGRDEKRREFIRHSIDRVTCFVAVADAKVIGYGVIDHSFFGDNGSIEMLCIDVNHRGRGAGMALVDYMEGSVQALNCSPRPIFQT